VVSYAALHIVIAVLIPLLTALVLFCRYCTICCCRPDRCPCLRCGAAWPTRKGRCGCGYGELVTKNKDGDVVESHLGYSTCSRVASFLFLLFFVVFGAAMVLVAHYQGSLALTSGFHDLVNGEAGSLGYSVRAAAQGSLPPVVHFVIDVASGTLVPFISGLNETLHAALDFDAVIDALVCVNATVAGLPDIGVAVGFLSALNVSLATVRGGVVGLDGGLTTLGDSKAAVVGNASQLTRTLDYLSGNMSAASAALAAAETQATALQTFQTTLAAPSTGTLAVADADLANVQNNFPPTSPTTFGQAGGPSTATDTTTDAPTLNGILTPPGLDANAAGINALVTKLTNLRTSLAALPSMSATATRLEGINAEILALRASSPPGTLALLTASLVDLQAALSALPRSSSFLGPIDGILAAAQGVDVGPITSSVLAIAGAIDSLPDFNILLAELDKISSVGAIIPCARSLVRQLDTVNATLVSLPDSVSGASDMIDTINSTLVSALSYVGDARSSITSANQSVADVDTTSYLDQLADVNATLASKRGDFNVSGLRARLADLDTQGALNFSSVVRQVADLQVTLANSSVPVDTILAIRAFGDYLAWTTGNLSARIADYTRMAKGYCANDAAACTTNSDCTASASCLRVAKFRCVDATANGGLTAQAIDCTQDSDCTAGQRCLADRTQAATLKGMLLGGAGQKPDVTVARGNIATATTNANSVNIGASLSDIRGAQSSIAGLTVSTYKTQVDAIETGFSAFDLAAVRTTVTDVLSTIDGVDVSSYLDSMNDMKSQTDMVNDYKSMLRDGIDAANNFRTFFRSDLRGYLAAISRPALDAAYAQRGPAAVVRTILSTAESAMTTAARDAAAFYTLPTMNLTSPTIEEYLVYLDKVAGAAPYAGLAALGPLHHLLSIASPSSVVDPLAPADPSVGAPKYAQASAKGITYPAGASCVTAACLTATSDAVNTQALSTLTTVGPAFPSLPVPLSREQIFLVPWVFPILALLFGLWALIAPFACCCRDGSWRKCPASCMVGAIICQLPCLFLFTALLFPLALVTTDFCASGPNVAVNYVASAGDGLCGFASGEGTAAACTFSFGLPSPVKDNVTATINIPSLVRGLLDDGCVATGDPLTPTVVRLAQQARSIPTEAAGDILNSSSSLLGSMTLRQRPRALVTDTAANAGAALSNFLLAFHATPAPANCKTIHSVYGELRDSMCCNVVGPLWWYISAWTLMAWAMLCCGLPAGCLARKRLPRKLWGRSYRQTDEYLAANGEATGMAVMAAAAATGSASAAKGVAGGSGGGGGGDPTTPRGTTTRRPSTPTGRRGRGPLVLEDVGRSSASAASASASSSGTTIAAPLTGPTVVGRGGGQSGRSLLNIRAAPAAAAPAPAPAPAAPYYPQPSAPAAHAYDATHAVDQANFGMLTPPRSLPAMGGRVVVASPPLSDQRVNIGAAAATRAPVGTAGAYATSPTGVLYPGGDRNSFGPVSNPGRTGRPAAAPPPGTKPGVAGAYGGRY
jgi:hypothetical protein